MAIIVVGLGSEPAWRPRARPYRDIRHANVPFAKRESAIPNSLGLSPNAAQICPSDCCMKALASALCGLMFASGMIAFLLPLLVNVKPGLLSDSFEWPPGYSENVITTVNGRHIVPNVPAGRIQIYSSGWCFIRGWNIPDANMSFIVMPFEEETQQIKVVGHTGGRGRDADRLSATYLFDMNGKLLSRETSPFSRSEYDSLPMAGESLWVPTRFWLLPLANPAIAWGIAMSALIGSWLIRRKGNLGKPMPEI